MKLPTKPCPSCKKHISNAGIARHIRLKHQELVGTIKKGKKSKCTEAQRKVRRLASKRKWWKKAGKHIKKMPLGS